MRVVISRDAERDLEQIADFIAEDNPLRAASFVVELNDKARDLGSFPERFPIAPQLEHLGIRRRSYGSYLIFYRIEPDRVVVLRYLHGARDYPGQFGTTQ